MKKYSIMKIFLIIATILLSMISCVGTTATSSNSEVSPDHIPVDYVNVLMGTMSDFLYSFSNENK